MPTRQALALAAVLALGSGLFAAQSAEADPFNYAPEKVGGVGPDGQTHALATDNSGNLTVAPSTGNLASQLVLTNSVIGYPDGGGAGSCYGTGGPALVGRLYAEVCNAAGNSGSPVLYLTWDGTTPVASGTVHGKSLAVGQCYVVPLPATDALNCASTAAATNVEIVERE